MHTGVSHGTRLLPQKVRNDYAAVMSQDVSQQQEQSYLDAAAAAREAGRYEEAERILDAAIGRFPDAHQIVIARAWLANAQRHWAPALRRWEAVLSRYPDAPAGYLGAANALRELGRLDEADAIAGVGVARCPQHEALVVAHAWLANARRDWPAALHRWADARARFPRNPWCCVGSAKALQGADRQDEAESVLAIAATMQPPKADPIATARLAFEIARCRLDWPAVRDAAQRIIAGPVAPAAQVWLGLAQACWHLGDPTGADAAAERAIDAEPGLSEAVLIRARAATDRGDGELALACYRRLVDLDPSAVHWSLKVVQLLNWLGRIDETIAELEKLHRQWPDNPMVRTYLRNYGPTSALSLGPTTGQGVGRSDPDGVTDAEFRILADKAPKPAMWARPLLVADPARDVLAATCDGASAAVLVFTGSNDAVSMPLALFDRHLAPLAVSAVYLKDFRRLRFLTGIASLADDYEGTVAALRHMLEGLGARRLCVIGNCDGGFAAIRYGIELGADRIVTFGAPTHSGSGAPAQFEQGRNFMRRRLASAVPADMIDLRPFLECRSYATDIQIHYESDDPRDRDHSMRLANLPGVTLHPWIGSSNHQLLRAIALADNDFAGTLAMWLGVERASEPAVVRTGGGSLH
jgi:tetratricopeptide (TPR) repeat protein